MERHQAQLILDHLDIIKHFAKGGMLEHHGHTCSGEKMVFPVTKGIIINCLPMYRKVNKFIEPPMPKCKCSRWCPIKRSCK